MILIGEVGKGKIKKWEITKILIVAWQDFM
jgi:hypothetical protein